MVKSYNVRGLNDEKKLRHLINSVYKLDRGKNSDLIFCLQETYISTPGMLPYLWRGNFHLTPGNGNSCGCLTLTSAHVGVIEGRNIENRAHVVVCQRSSDNEVSYIIVNLYAPNPNNSEKIEFFDRIFNAVNELSEKYNCEKIIMAGDFNTVFKSCEIKNRNYSAQEKRVADSIKILMNTSGLRDAWENKCSYTWRRPNSDTFSTIDRILFSEDFFLLNDIKSDWTLSFSDHATIHAGFEIKGKKRTFRSKITRLDASLASSSAYAPRIRQEFEEMMLTAPSDWSPHMRLDFAKMCIRTIVEKAQADRKRAETSEEESVNEELEVAIEKLANGHVDGGLLDYVEELRAKKSRLIEEKGKRLAEKLGTKWYNEGEKSSRYFMRLLKRSMPDDFEKIENENGDIVNEPQQIEAEIVKFYKTRYEQDDIVINVDYDFFNEINPISAEDGDEISAEVTLEELHRTLETCRDSAPGPDGIPYSIIKLLWPLFGKILLEAWHYSLVLKELPPSHKKSYLKLIPKAGKDLSKLTNWRPITLSNCDHKVITKLYANRLSKKLASEISEMQTAYIKGRLINDNIRSMLSMIELGNEEENLKGLLVSLDAKKAFDSVDHGYIEQCLEKFGCRKFIPIFKTLYKNLETDIIINGKITKGFKIKKGVKQGDALSCILFIMCIEPLLRNIEANPLIERLYSETLNKSLPKAFAYADDVCGAIADKENSLQAVFSEYEKLSKKSGLILNAEKTELMKIGSDLEGSYSISYRRQRHVIRSGEKMKVNGVIFQRDRTAMVNANVEAVVERMDRQFRNWSKRSLSTLGKILICKTFGVSQLIYLLQSVRLEETHYKKINALLFKFIWNRHYLANKAPERIKREIVCSALKLGGLGMLDIVELDNSLKLRSLGRLIVTEHPFLKIINELVNLDSFFNPSFTCRVEPVTKQGIELLAIDRNKLWVERKLDRDRQLLATIKEMGIRDLVDRRGQGSISYFNLWAAGKRKLKDLTSNDVESLRRHINEDKMVKLRLAVACNLRGDVGDFNKTYYSGTVHRKLSSLSSKEFRTSRSQKKPIEDLKIGIKLTTQESLTWALKLSRLTSTRHKNTLLKVAHGEVYTKAKLFRFGLVGDDTCPRCDETESLKHKIVDCHYAKRIWEEAKTYLEKLSNVATINNDCTKIAIAATLDSSLGSMTLTAEILQTILQLNPEQTYLLHPKHLVRQAINRVRIKESNNKIKRGFIDL